MSVGSVNWPSMKFSAIVNDIKNVWHCKWGQCVYLLTAFKSVKDVFIQLVSVSVSHTHNPNQILFGNGAYWTVWNSCPSPIVPSLLIPYSYEVLPLPGFSPKAGHLKRHTFDVSFTLLDTHSSDSRWCLGGVSSFLWAREMNCWSALYTHVAQSQVVLNKVKPIVDVNEQMCSFRCTDFPTMAVLHLADDMSRWQTFPLSPAECDCTAALLAVSYNCVTSVWREVQLIYKDSARLTCKWCEINI